MKPVSLVKSVAGDPKRLISDELYKMINKIININNPLTQARFRPHYQISDKYRSCGSSLFNN